MPNESQTVDVGWLGRDLSSDEPGFLRTMGDLAVRIISLPIYIVGEYTWSNIAMLSL